MKNIPLGREKDIKDQTEHDRGVFQRLGDHESTINNGTKHHYLVSHRTSWFYWSIGFMEANENVPYKVNAKTLDQSVLEVQDSNGTPLLSIDHVSSFLSMSQEHEFSRNGQLVGKMVYSPSLLGVPSWTFTTKDGKIYTGAVEGTIDPTITFCHGSEICAKLKTNSWILKLFEITVEPGNDLTLMLGIIALMMLQMRY
jgi:hypothetical protein